MREERVPRATKEDVTTVAELGESVNRDISRSMRATTLTSGSRYSASLDTPARRTEHVLQSMPSSVFEHWHSSQRVKDWR